MGHKIFTEEEKRWMKEIREHQKKIPGLIINDDDMNIMLIIDFTGALCQLTRRLDFVSNHLQNLSRAPLANIPTDSLRDLHCCLEFAHTLAWGLEKLIVSINKAHLHKDLGVSK